MPVTHAPVRVNLLRGFELLVDDRAVEVPSSAQRVVAYLALHERPQLRTVVASSLWLDVPCERAAANLRGALWKLHDLRDQVITARASYLSLGTEVVVDVADVVRDARALLEGSAELPRRGDTRLQQLSGDLLPGWDEDWILFERERLRQLCVHAMEALCRQLTGGGQHADAVEAGLAAVGADPLRESAQRVLIEAHLAEGNAAEARRQYASFVRLLADSLGIPPSPRLGALVGVDSAEGRRGRD